MDTAQINLPKPTHLFGNQINQVLKDHEPNAKVDLQEGLVLQVLQVRDTFKQGEEND